MCPVRKSKNICMYNELYGMKITNKAVKCIGIYIDHDKEECYAKNWKYITILRNFLNPGKKENSRYLVNHA